MGEAEAAGPADEPLWQELRVKQAPALSQWVYLAPGATSFVSGGDAGPRPDGHLRVVCISDTHNEHEGIQLPEGDVLVHSGDCLTESGLRHVLRQKRKDGGWEEIVSVRPLGVELFRRFAEWFGRQRFKYKVLVAGNHDLVLQGMGKKAVQGMLDEYAKHGSALYLQHEEGRFGPLRVFGSPYSRWGSHNDAFLCDDPDFKDVPEGVHIVVTHKPNILPKKSGLSENKRLSRALHRTGALLHVSGHCHWAHGVYMSEGSRGQIPCVVASVCDSHWHFRTGSLTNPTGVRGDPVDGMNGGYNLKFPIIVCDIAVAGMDEHEQPLSAHDTDSTELLREASMHSLEAALRGEESSRPRLLFFGPPNDPETVQRLLPRLSDHYVVDHADSQAAGERLARSRSYVACVAKLGTKGNLGAEVVKALRQAQGGYPYVVFHSATARGSEQTMARLREQVAADGFFDHDSEDALLAAVMPAPGAAFTPPRGRPPPLPRLLLFGPPNDPEMPRRLTSLLERAYQVDHFDTTAAGAAAAAERPYAACVAKLGTKGNLGYQVVHALRRAQGPTPFIAVHSATAAKDPAIRDRWTRELRVDTFADHSSEQDLVQKLLSLSSRSS
eukprot:TRINITY_DN1426_c3_g1_i1.p1 TRINITY_DN1426_c3_g1~~TRINITY_DN1426_c3_g1_i1.p1  ORF type:complete len:639 (+),score=185.29 TRINITY_DN1426_c3_g1_i1:85-1917(+)